jgi:hypothetical protein
MTRLRFGIMCSGLTLPAWQAACIRSLIASGLAAPALLIVEDDPPGRLARLRGEVTGFPLRRTIYLVIRRGVVAPATAAAFVRQLLGARRGGDLLRRAAQAFPVA